MAAPSDVDLEATNVGADKELDDLLDSCLEDLTSDAAAPSIPNPATGPDHVDEAGSNTSNEKARGDSIASAEIPGANALFSEMFDSDLAKEITSQFEAAMQDIVSSDPAMAEDMKKLSEAAMHASESASSNQNSAKFSDCLAETLNSLTKNAEELNAPDSKLENDDLNFLQSLSGLNLGEKEESNLLDIMPMVNEFMKTLLSKEVLYPSLIDISEKLPRWLEENKDSLVQNEYDRYRRQSEIVCQACREFDSEQPNETETVKQERFDRIIKLMFQMQEYGQPPKDILDGLGSGLPFGEGMANIPGLDKEQCCIS